MAKRKYPTFPSHIRITPKKDYQIVYIDEFKDVEQLGECRFNPPQIIVKKGTPPKEEFGTICHEVAHAMSEEYDINLTENQVLRLEKAIVAVLRLNGWI